MVVSSKLKGNYHTYITFLEKNVTWVLGTQKR